MDNNKITITLTVKTDVHFLDVQDAIYKDAEARGFEVTEICARRENKGTIGEV